MQSFTILQTPSGSRRLVSSSRLFIILHTSRGRRRLLLAIQCFTILQTSSGRRRLLRATQFFTKADHDEQARCGCKFQQDRDKQARGECFILRFNVKFADFSCLRGRRIGEALNPGHRLRRRGPRSVEARTGRLQRRAAPTTAGGSEVCEELNLIMLHLNLRGFLSHIAEVTAVIRDMPAKPFLVCLNETFLTKAVEEVKLEGVPGFSAARPRRSMGRRCTHVRDGRVFCKSYIGWNIWIGKTYMGHCALRQRASCGLLLVSSARP